jgi:hypothetical protein
MLAMDDKPIAYPVGCTLGSGLCTSAEVECLEAVGNKIKRKLQGLNYKTSAQALTFRCLILAGETPT